MKKINYILFILLLSFSGKSVSYLYAAHSEIVVTSETKLEQKKHSLSFAYQHGSSNLKKQKWPKKPKGIQVIVPNVSKTVFKKFSHRTTLVISEVKGEYTLILSYSHGKRGPPSDVV